MHVIKFGICDFIFCENRPREVRAFLRPLIKPLSPVYHETVCYFESKERLAAPFTKATSANTTFVFLLLGMTHDDFLRLAVMKS